MNITKEMQEKEIIFSVSGRLDTTTAPDLERELKVAYDEAEVLTLDFANLNYISSAGLRVLLSAQKTMNKKGSMRLISVSDNIMEVLELTGFSEILTIE